MPSFSKSVLATIRDGLFIRIQAGTEPHKFIGIWAVVVEDRVFVRSWRKYAEGLAQPKCRATTTELKPV